MTDPDAGASLGDAAWAPPAPGAPATPAAEGLLAGYRDFVVVAHGGDSVVYRARQDNPDRDVAIKVIQLDDPETVARFRRELDITVRLGRQHPHIVTVLAAGTTASGQPCLVMDYCELGSLHDRLRERGPLAVSEAVAAASQVADALAFAHSQGVLHRDVKPQNVLVLPTSYVLADFGLARAADAGHTASLERFSYRHASPQILDGEAPTTADDIYSLGSTLFTLLDGRPPFAADAAHEDTALAYLRRARTSMPRRLARDDIPDELAAIVDRCLAKQRADRFPDAGALRAALESLPTETRSWAPDAAAPPPPPRRGAGPAESATPPDSPPPSDPPPSDPPPSDPPPPAEPSQTEPSQAGLPRDEPAAADPPSYGAPEPVAVSALAHLGRPAPHPDEDTGLRPPGPPSPEAPEPPEPSEPPRRWRWLAVAVIAVAAVVAGVLIGMSAAGSPRHEAHTPSPTPPPTTTQRPVAPVPTASVGPLTGSATAHNDPRLAPKITSIERHGKGVALAYTDPSDGKATFVIFLADGSPTPITTAKPGVTKVVLDNLPGRHCLTVLAVLAHTDGTTSYGRSEPACVR